MVKKKDSYFELMMSGTGGQGIVLAGSLLAEAAYVAYEHAVYCPNYGAARRGGETECTVIFSNTEVFSPIKLQPMAAVVMSKMGCNQLSKRVHPEGVLLVDSSVVPDKIDRQDISVYYLPATKVADENGSAVMASLLMVGAYIQLTEALSLEGLYESLEKRLRGTRAEKLLSLNKKVMAEGAKIMKSMQCGS